MRIKQIIKNTLPYGIVKKYSNNPDEIGNTCYPEVFNVYGEPMIFMYLDNNRCAHTPYSQMSGRYPRRIIWDRYNTALKHQMYSHLSIFDRVPIKEGVHQYGIMHEAEIICHEEYDLVYKKSSYIKSLDALFTFSERLLDKYPNAKFSLCNGVWYGTKMYGGELDPLRFEKKTKLLSAIASAKNMTPMQEFRANVARELKRKNLADCMGMAVGQYFEKISDAFDDYMYNVAIENESQKYYFTEKILDCFASMTIPIYYGAGEIGKFFNLDGIICIKNPTMDSVYKAIANCSADDYLSRKDAIIDNYNRVQRYLSVDDYLTNNYWELFR